MINVMNWDLYYNETEKLYKELSYQIDCCEDRSISYSAWIANYPPRVFLNARVVEFDGRRIQWVSTNDIHAFSPNDDELAKIGNLLTEVSKKFDIQCSTYNSSGELRYTIWLRRDKFED